jgi:putative solute:sodium symporter small subunit
MFVIMSLWAAFALVAQALALPLNGYAVPYLGIPLGVFLAGETALVAFAAILWLFLRRQDHIDRDHGFDEQS